MEHTQWLSMATFALVSSISPGPVNLICLSSGTRHQTLAGLRFALGATLAYVLLFLAVGFGLASLLLSYPSLQNLLRYAGVGFLLFLSWQLLRDKGELTQEAEQSVPGFWSGALLQWLNPKAWLAASAGISTYTDAGQLQQVLIFAALYLPICGLSLSVWVGAGRFLRRYVSTPAVMRMPNRLLGAMLAISCLWLLRA